MGEQKRTESHANEGYAYLLGLIGSPLIALTWADIRRGVINDNVVYKVYYGGGVRLDEDEVCIALNTCEVDVAAIKNDRSYALMGLEAVAGNNALFTLRLEMSPLFCQAYPRLLQRLLEKLVAHVYGPRRRRIHYTIALSFRPIDIFMTGLIKLLEASARR